MDIKVLKEDENKLFNRKEVRFEVIHDGEATPKLTEVRLKLATKTGSNPSHVVIDGFKTLFGIGRTIGDARIYQETKDLKEYEPHYLLERNNLVEKKEEKKEEPEKKEKKEEVKEEKGEESGKQG
ncbi:30S ribosomal protein S24e [archaeon]|nr:30S ribosomal protein S24e [archaeon]